MSRPSAEGERPPLMPGDGEDVTPTPAPARVPASRVVRLVGALLIGWLPVLVARDTVSRVASMFALAESGTPYFMAEHTITLYLLSPLVAMSACVMLMTPGLLLAIAFDRAASLAEWVLHGFALSLILVSAAVALVQAVVPVAANGLIGIVALSSALAMAALAVRMRRSPPRWPLDAPYARSGILWMLGVPAVLFAGLTPKFYWENFNGDGAHALEAARLLLQQPVPFWPPGAGEIGGFPGVTSVLYAYPAAWFIRLFGSWEIAARLPYVLYLPVLYGALVPLICEGRSWVPHQTERLLIWLTLTVYTVAVMFSATYSPYSADVALPATQDTLLVICFLGFVLASLRRDHGWLAVFALLTFLSLPNGLVLLALWACAMFVTARRRRAAAAAFAVAGCIAFGFVLPPLLNAAGLPAPGGEYRGGSLLLRFAFLQLTDLSRLLYVVLPCGILPALSLVLWPKLDPNARALALVTIAYFLFVYVQAHAPLHYYIPAMLLPLIVYWRLDPIHTRRPLAIGANIAASTIALLLVMPDNPHLFLEAREVGETIEVRVGNWEKMDPEAFRASTLLHEILPYDWEPDVPEHAFGTSPLVLHYYARQPKPPGIVINYVLQRAEDPPPPAMRRAAYDTAFAIYFRSTDVWNSHRRLQPATPPGSRLLDVPRGVLFRSEPLPEGFRLIDLPALAARLGFDVDALARRLGIRP